MYHSGSNIPDNSLCQRSELRDLSLCSLVNRTFPPNSFDPTRTVRLDCCGDSGHFSRRFGISAVAYTAADMTRQNCGGCNGSIPFLDYRCGARRQVRRQQRSQWGVVLLHFAVCQSPGRLSHCPREFSTVREGCREIGAEEMFRMR